MGVNWGGPAGVFSVVLYISLYQHKFIQWSI